jgi:hypothetical protein
MPNFLGSLLGLFVGAIIGAMLLVAASVSTLAMITWAMPFALWMVGGMAFNQIMFLAALLSFVFYLIGYIIATAAISSSLTPPPGAPLADINGELFARGFLIGLTAMLDFVLLNLLLPLCLVGAAQGLFCTALSAALVALPPWFWPFLPVTVMLIDWLSAFPACSRNSYFQVLVGWISWIAPMSYIATSVGFVLFLINLPFSLFSFGFGAFRIDFITGTIESTGGLVAAVSRATTGYPGAATAVGAFSLGKFNFVIPATAGPSAGLASQSAFTGPTICAHEIGHGLNTSCMGGVVLWINAVDENVPPFSNGALAYGELLAESHSNRPGRNAVRIWS